MRACASSGPADAARAAAGHTSQQSAASRLPDGRWFDPATATWRDRRGRPARWPTLLDAIRLRTTRVVPAAAYLDHEPRNNRLRNLRALCQRCHMLHDQPHHLAQRWLTYRRRNASGDLFLGAYRAGAYRAISGTDGPLSRPRREA